ncbi:hypothetical protein N7G274_003412 [Stereocaulon virgatum]|uniref:Uncharacterized protein n=1 Tax=Stereocaulon virgatum TaxID=373712 RepID=A0ABR4AH25_9LECA
MFPSFSPAFSWDAISEHITSDLQLIPELLKLQLHWAHFNSRVLEHVGKMLSKLLLPPTQPAEIRKLTIAHWLDTLDAISTGIETYISHISLSVKSLESMSLTATSASVFDVASTHVPKMYTDLEILKAKYGQQLREIGVKAGQMCIGETIYDNPAIEDDLKAYGNLLTPWEAFVLRQDSVEKQRKYFRSAVEYYERLKSQQPDSKQWMDIYRQLLGLTLEAKRSSWALDAMQADCLDTGAGIYTQTSSTDVSPAAQSHESKATPSQTLHDDSDLAITSTILSGSRQTGGEAGTPAERAHCGGEHGLVGRARPTSLASRGPGEASSNTIHSRNDSMILQTNVKKGSSSKLLAADEPPSGSQHMTSVPSIEVTPPAQSEDNTTSELAYRRESASLGATTKTDYLAPPGMYPQIDAQDADEETTHTEPQSASQGRRRKRNRYVKLENWNL